MLKAQQRACIKYKRRRGVCVPTDSMPVGSFVLMRMPRRRGDTKLHPNTEGPYRVQEYNPDLTRVRLGDAAGRTWAVSVSRIAPYSPQPAALAPPAAPAHA
jgi:hypothetical protein